MSQFCFSFIGILLFYIVKTVTHGGMDYFDSSLRRFIKYQTHPEQLSPISKVYHIPYFDFRISLFYLSVSNKIIKIMKIHHGCTGGCFDSPISYADDSEEDLRWLRRPSDQYWVIPLRDKRKETISCFSFFLRLLEFS